MGGSELGTRSKVAYLERCMRGDCRLEEIAWIVAAVSLFFVLFYPEEMVAMRGYKEEKVVGRDAARARGSVG